MAPETTRTEMRPMDFGGLMDTAVRIMKTAWKPLLLTGLIGAIPAIIYNGLYLSLFPTNTADPDFGSNAFVQAFLRTQTNDYSRLFELGGLLLVLLLFMLAVGLWIHGALIVVASRAYLGLPVTAGMGLRLAGRRYPALLGTGLLFVVFSIPAVIGLVIGGLLFLAILTVPAGLVALGVYTTFTWQALIVEGAAGGTPAMRRSFQLVSGRFWPLLGLGIVFSLFTGALNMQLSIISQIPLQFALTFINDPGLAAAVSWAVALFTGLISALITPLGYVGLTLAYYDTRMRKEGLDIELMMTAQAAGEQTL